MDIPTIVNIALCVLSFILSAVSVVTVVITLRQNSKMIEESTRPVVSIYAQTINPGIPMLYLVIRNFGNSSAYMQKFSSDFDFSNCYKFDAPRNFIEDFSKCVLAPGQSRTCLIDYEKLTSPIHFSIEYKSSTKTYHEELDVDLKAAADMPTSKYSTKNKELLSISYSLQELLLKKL